MTRCQNGSSPWIARRRARSSFITNAEPTAWAKRVCSAPGKASEVTPSWRTRRRRCTSGVSMSSSTTRSSSASKATRPCTGSRRIMTRHARGSRTVVADGAVVVKTRDADRGAAACVDDRLRGAGRGRDAGTRSECQAASNGPSGLERRIDRPGERLARRDELRPGRARRRRARSRPRGRRRRRRAGARATLDRERRPRSARAARATWRCRPCPASPRIARRPSACAASPVVPLPAKRSTTRPLRASSRSAMMRSSSARGFCVGNPVRSPTAAWRSGGTSVQSASTRRSRHQHAARVLHEEVLHVDLAASASGESAPRRRGARSTRRCSRRAGRVVNGARLPRRPSVSPRLDRLEPGRRVSTAPVPRPARARAVNEIVSSVRPNCWLVA